MTGVVHTEGAARPAASRPPSVAGSLLLGLGLGGFVDGIVIHQLLQWHRDDLGGPLSWDLGFLAFGAALLFSGWALYRVGRRDLLGRAERSGTTVAR